MKLTPETSLHEAVRFYWLWFCITSLYRDPLCLSLIHSLHLSVCVHVRHPVYLSSKLCLSARLSASLSQSVRPSLHLSRCLSLSLPACRSVTQPRSRCLPVSLSQLVCLSAASLSGLHGVRLANMDVGGGETKCSSRHKAALIRSPPPPHSRAWLQKSGCSAVRQTVSRQTGWEADRRVFGH